VAGSDIPLDQLRAEEETKELAQAVIELVHLSPNDDIASFVCDKVGELAGEAIVSVSSIDAEKGTLRVRKVIGVDPDILSVIDGQLDHKVSEGPFEGVHEEALSQLSGGKLAKLEGRLYQMFFDRVPESLRDSIEQTVGARDVYSIGLVREGSLLGNVTILPMAGASLNRNVIEAFVATASIALERRHAQEQLRQRENELAQLARIAAMGEVAAELAHEVNQPLYAVTNYALGTAMRLRNDAADPAQLGEVMKKITEQARRASDIIERLGDVVRKHEPCRSTIYLNDPIQDVLKLVEHDIRKDSVSVNLDLHGELPLVLADAVQIQQVVLSLVRNALEAMRDTPTKRRRLTLVTTVADDETMVEVDVADSGKGLDAKAGDRIFDPFFSTKPNGLGMGLAISRTIVEAHDGRIWTTPNRPCGAVFRFVIPTAKREADGAD